MKRLMRLFAPLVLLAVAVLVAACEPTTPRTGAKTPELDAALLDKEIAVIADSVQPAELEVAVQNLEGGEMWAWNGQKAFPLQSVFKMVLGAAVLAEVDAGRLALDDQITLTEADISPPYSPVADAWPETETYTVRELLEKAVGDSDNTAADVLMKRIGGPGAVTAWLRAKRIKEFRVDRYERELQPESQGLGSFRIAWKSWPAWVAARDEIPEAARRKAQQDYLADPRDTATASGVLNFLRQLSAGELLKPASTQLLLKIMTDSPTGEERLKAGLPPGATIAHKSATAATDLGLTLATNDVGVVTLKDGRRYAVVVFLAASSQDDPTRDAAIAEAMRVIVKAAG
ncbi:serine hydrolase [Caulobacter mirabilis]|uniref:Beta-lactamase n=2 Tax=Caulobacter mirabilis TaxID=69666 RepID=A0A2D2AVK1_9CAUL|nr:serine hydrolase [Caulobacter mirabilis]